MAFPEEKLFGAKLTENANPAEVAKLGLGNRVMSTY